MQLNKLLLDGKISLRVFNLCQRNRLNTLNEIKEHYQKYGTFRNLNGFGMASDYKLKRIYDSIEDLISRSTINIKEIYDNLTPTQIAIINCYIDMQTSKLEKRCQTALGHYLEKDFRLRNFIKKIFNEPEFHNSTLNHIGPKFGPVIEEYLSSVKDFIIQLAQNKNEEEINELLCTYLINKIYGINHIPIELIKSNNIFKWTDFLLNKNSFFNERTNTILIQTSNIYEPQNPVHEGIDDILNLSKEQIRRITSKCFEKLISKLEFLKIFNDKLEPNYSIDPEKDFIVISDKAGRLINHKCDTHFSRQFITFILSSYLNKEFILIGDAEYVLTADKYLRRKGHKWKNIYLLRENIAKGFDFLKLADDIHTRLVNKIEETYSLNFRNYLLNFLTTNNLNILEGGIVFLKILLLHEFNINITSNNIILKRNTRKSAYEYAFEALEHLGKPSHVKLIYKKIGELYPDHETTLVGVRASMKQKFGFVPIGRSSTFGLKKWEQELDNFKGGTIRSITKELLEKSGMPKHISEIADYVLRFRPTSNRSNIFQNLQLDKSGTFVFFKNSYIGLNGKKYNGGFIKVNKKLR